MAVPAEVLPLDPRGRPTNLPLQLTTFVGREREVAEVTRLLAATRLLTLVGAGGVGKTRLALRVAEDLLESYPDGVWLVELASLADPALVPRTVAATLGVSKGAGQSFTEALARTLQSKHLLLVLDNCEHLVVACAELADHLLRACPHLQVLATSRQPLGISGEIVWRVPSLTIPDPRVTMGTDEVAGAEAVCLFLNRAQSALPGFVLEDRNAAAVAEICRRLDGIPLAIELAAACVKMLSPEQILQRLDDRFRLLVSGSRTAPSRQQTLRATLDWSFELLSEPERVLFGRLAVFAGGWTLEAAEAVCAGDGLRAEQILEVLGQLVDKSIVLAETQTGPARYRLLETLRQYAQERLADSGQASAVQCRHAAFFLALVEQAEPAVLGPDQTAWFGRLEREHDNLRAALRWSIDAGQAETSLRLTGALGTFWIVRGHRREGQQWLKEAVAMGAAGAAAARAKALAAAGLMAGNRGEYDWTASAYEESLSLLRQLGDTRGLASVLGDLARVERRRGSYERATALLQEGLRLQRDLGDRHGAALTLSSLGQVAADQGDYRAAETLYQESLALFRELGDRHRVGHVLDYFGLVARGQGDRQRAAELFEQSLALFHELGCKEGIADALIHLAALMEQTGSHERALALSAESVRLYWELDARWGLAEALESLAVVVSRRGQSELAGCFFGTAEALRERGSLPLRPSRRAEYEQAVAAARHRAGADAFAAAWAEGRLRPLEQVLDEVQRIARPAPMAGLQPLALAPDAVGPLSRREQEVADLIARGLSNRDIAEALVITERTAEAHVTHILSKLGLRSRAQIAVWAAQHGRLPAGSSNEASVASERGRFKPAVLPSPSVHS